MRRQLLAAVLVSRLMVPAIASAAEAIKPNPLDEPQAVVSECNVGRDRAGCGIVALITQADVIYSSRVAATSLDLTEIHMNGPLAKDAKLRLGEKFKRGFDVAPVTRLLDEADNLAKGGSVMPLVATHRATLMSCFSASAPSAETTRDRDTYAQQTAACEARAARSLDVIARRLHQPTNAPQFDFRKSLWGDTQQAVLTAEGKPVRQTPNSLVFASSVAGLKAMAVYHFAEGKLTDAGYVIEEVRTDHARYAADFKTVTTGLTAKYGMPVRSLVETKDPALKASPDRWGQGIALGELSLRDDWESPITRVSHVIISDKLKMGHIVTYESYEFAAERERSRAAAKASGIKPSPAGP